MDGYELQGTHVTPEILVFGADGQVGFELRRSLAAIGTVVPVTRDQVDLRDAMAVRAAIQHVKPDTVVNAAAYTAVDKAETEVEHAFAINAAAPAVMAEEARAAGIPLVHYSSDYVYDGRKGGPYDEDDATNPLSVYARSKLAGDEAILASGVRAVILRTSWVYAARGANFLKTILRLAGERDSLRIVSDQVGAPTSAGLLADVTAQVLQPMYSGKSDDGVQYGVFHCAAAGETSWHGYANLIVAEAIELGAKLQLTPERIEAIPAAQYPTPALRPKNSRLNCSKLKRTFGLQLPPWEMDVRQALRELLS
jgi:dTDP-4-dehydrorhamnose reductase